MMLMAFQPLRKRRGALNELGNPIGADVFNGTMVAFSALPKRINGRLRQRP